MRIASIACLLVPWSLAVPAAAQSMPAGETAPLRELSPRAAFALSVLEDLVRQRDAMVAAGRAPRAGLFDIGLLALSGYQVRFVERGGEDDAVKAIAPLRNPTSMHWGLFAFPAQPAAAQEGMFFVAEGGALLWSPNARSYRSGPPPDVAAAVASAGARTWSARQLAAGTSVDGESWQTTAALPASTQAVVVVDDRGAPLPLARVMLVPARGLPITDVLPKGVPLAAAAPAGLAEVDERGRGTVRGVVARELVVRVSLAGTPLVVAPAAVTMRDGTLHVVVAHADQDATARNEMAALHTLRHLASGQAQCQAAGEIDADGDGTGEYGFFAELASASLVRSDAAGGVGTKRIEPPVISESCGRVTQSRVTKHGYHFQIFLRDSAGKWVSEDADGDGGRGVAVDPDRAEQSWCCLAWPARHDWTGKRAFFVDSSGEVLAHANDGGAFTGSAPPSPWATGEPPPGWVAAQD